jgi:hypothetical protein
MVGIWIPPLLPSQGTRRAFLQSMVFQLEMRTTSFFACRTSGWNFTTRWLCPKGAICTLHSRFSKPSIRRSASSETYNKLSVTCRVYPRTIVFMYPLCGVCSFLIVCVKSHDESMCLCRLSLCQSTFSLAPKVCRLRTYWPTRSRSNIRLPPKHCQLAHTLCHRRYRWSMIPGCGCSQ